MLHTSARVILALLALQLAHGTARSDPAAITVYPDRALNVIATRDPQTGDVIVKVVNPSETDDVAADLRIGGAAPQNVRMWRVHAPSIDDVNSLDEPDRIRVVASESGPSITFPAHSVTVLRTHP